MNELVLAVRDGHLHKLVNLVQVGGRGLLVTDFVSSDSLPDLADVPKRELPRLACRAIVRHNFFTGTNPLALLAWFRQAAMAGDIDLPQLVGPWRWWVGLARAYLVVAVMFCKRVSA